MKIITNRKPGPPVVVAPPTPAAPAPEPEQVIDFPAPSAPPVADSPAVEIGLQPQPAEPQAVVHRWQCTGCKSYFENTLTPEQIEVRDAMPKLTKLLFPEKMVCDHCDPSQQPHQWNDSDNAAVMSVLKVGSREHEVGYAMLIERHWRSLAESYDRAHNVRTASLYHQRADKLRRERLGLGPDAGEVNQWWQSACPRQFQDTKVEKTKNVVAAKRIVAWNLNTETGRGLVVIGHPQRGKSRSLWLLLQRIGRPGVVWCDMATWCSELQSRFGNQNENTPLEWLNEQAVAPLLILDDLDKMPRTADTGRINSHAATALFGIIKHRTENKLPMLVTANAVGDELVAIFPPEIGAPLVERLREYCDPVIF